MLKNKLKMLMVMSFVLAFLGGQDAITSTILYNKLDLSYAIRFKIYEKYNKKDRQIFPDLNFKGKIIETDSETEIKVSKGDFDKHNVGQIITVYKTKSNKFMTEWEIENCKIIHIYGIGFSLSFVPAIIFFIIGIFCLVIVLKEETLLIH